MSKSTAIFQAPLTGESKSENADLLSIELTALEKTVFKLLNTETKVVGSAVWRRILTGKLDPKKDIDFETTATPQQIMNLKENQLFFNPSENRETLFRCDHTTPPLDIEISEKMNSRRNFTICAIFLNGLGKIEDPTGRGLHDLQHRIIATIPPFTPEQTFEEDQLRILQAIALLNEGFNFDQRKFLTKKGIYQTMAETILDFGFNLNSEAKDNSNPGRLNAWFLKKFNDKENVSNLLFNLIQYDVFKKLFKPLHEIKIIQKHEEICTLIQKSEHSLKLTEIYMLFVSSVCNGSFEKCKKLISKNILLKTAFEKTNENKLFELFKSTNEQLKITTTNQNFSVAAQGHFKPTRRSKKKKHPPKTFFLPEGAPLLVEKSQIEQLLTLFPKKM